MLYALGTDNSGLSLFVQDDRLVFDYNAFGDHAVVESTAPVPVGASRVGVRFRREGNGATATLVIDGVECGSVEIPFAMRIISSVGRSVGYDHGRPVSDRYDDTFPFEGALRSLDIELVSADADRGARGRGRRGAHRHGPPVTRPLRPGPGRPRTGARDGSRPRPGSSPACGSRPMPSRWSPVRPSAPRWSSPVAPATPI